MLIKCDEVQPSHSRYFILSSFLYIFAVYSSFETHNCFFRLHTLDLVYSSVVRGGSAGSQLDQTEKMGETTKIEGGVFLLSVEQEAGGLHHTE